MTFDELKNQALNLPMKPGVYIMMDKSGEVIYVGKAKLLRNRVSSYFRGTHDDKTKLMVSKIDHYDTIIANSEFDALVTESSLIKHHKPRYNILLKDDKGYPFARLSINDEYPRFTVESKPLNDKAKYLGPYNSRTILYDTIDAVLKTLKLPVCSRRFPADLKRERPCLNFHLGLCSGFCRGEPDSAEYNKRIGQAVMLLEGKNDELREITQKQMEEAARELRFERAADLRDRLKALSVLANKQLIAPGNMSDMDVAAFYRGSIKCCFVILHYIGGRLLGKDYELLENPLENNSESISALMRQFYQQRGSCPQNIIVSENLSDLEDLERFFSETYGRRVYITIPQKGDKRKLVALALENAQEECERISDKQERISKTLELLQKALGLDSLPYRIEAYDISNTGGSDIVGSMTVFENAKPLKRDYRRFKIKHQKGQDDYHSMQEILSRRFKRYLSGDDKFSELPSLLLTDGGQAHALMAHSLLWEMGISIPVFGMVKDDRHRTRALISPDGLETGIQANQTLFSLIGKIQEETHRFAIEYHRKLRSKNVQRSQLDAISGVGEARRTALLKAFKSINAIENATLEELCAVIPKNAAAAVYQYFHGV